MKFDQRDYDKRKAPLSETLMLYGMVGVILLFMSLEIFTHYEPRKIWPY